MIAAILLAAGESTRMGRPKPLLKWGDSTLVEYQVAQLAAVPPSLEKKHVDIDVIELSGTVESVVSHAMNGTSHRLLSSHIFGETYAPMATQGVNANNMNNLDICPILSCSIVNYCMGGDPTIRY